MEHSKIYNTLKTMQGTAALVSASSASVATSIAGALKGLENGDDTQVLANLKALAGAVNMFVDCVEAFEISGSALFGGSND